MTRLLAAVPPAAITGDLAASGSASAYNAGTLCTEPPAPESNVAPSDPPCALAAAGTAAAPPGPPTLASDRSCLDIAILLALGLALGLLVRGHFAKPHTDFYQLWETGAELLDGTLPASFKRAPVYPLLIAGAGRLFEAAGVREAPALLAAEWLNALLLPLNALLLYLIARPLAGAAACWAAWWFLLLPIGLYCTAHALLEPLLIAVTLLTLLLVQRGSAWAYLAAALATMTRYDMAGLIPGVLLADLAAGRSRRAALWRAAGAAGPLAVWLILTAATWSTRSEGHYLIQLAESPQFDFAYATGVVQMATFEIARLRFPYLLDALAPLVRNGVAVGLLLCLTLGVGTGFWRWRVLWLTAAAAAIGYLSVHARFHYPIDRFGYPLAPLYLIAAAAGWRAIPFNRLPQSIRSPMSILAIPAAILLALALYTELNALRMNVAEAVRWTLPLPALLLLGAGALWSASKADGGIAPPTGRGTPRREKPWFHPSPSLALCALLLAATLALASLRATSARLAGGRDMENLVTAARWVREHVPPNERVLSAFPGLLRLYVGRDEGERFLGFEDIRAGSWPAILEECRKRDIQYILWHDAIWLEIGKYYIQRTGLERFRILSQPGEPPGLHLERLLPERPELHIYRVEGLQGS